MSQTYPSPFSTFLWWAVGGSIVLFTLFKFCYPYPDFISDSYNYIESAAYHLDVNLWPIGYAKFLALIHVFSHNDKVLVSIQYALLQLALFGFFYSIIRLFQPSKLVRRFLFVVLLYNPLSIYISNCILGDALFATFTIAWLTTLLWQLRAPSRLGLAFQVLLIGLAFTVRPTAMYYPLVAAVLLFLCPLRRTERLAWILAPALLILPFIFFTKAKTRAITGHAQFSVFAGWQLANNALYMYDDIKVDSAEIPLEFRPIDKLTRQFFASVRLMHLKLDFADFTGAYFIKVPESPLKVYMILHCQNEMTQSSFLAWGKLSPMYSAYGSWLIRRHPVDFATHFLWLNAKNYFTPPLEKFEIYNYESDSTWPAAQPWFHWPTPYVHSLSTSLPGAVFYVYPPIFMVLNFYFLGVLLWLGFTRKYLLLTPLFQKALALAAIFWLANFAFSVFAAPVVLRYQITPYVLIFTFSLLQLEFTDKSRLTLLNS